MKSTEMKSPSTNQEFWAEIHSTYTEEELKESASLRAIVHAHYFKKRLAQAIRQKREALNLTQRQLAQLAHTSQREISFLEQAKGNQTLASVSRVLFILELQLEIKK